jgi:hypothetical protein
MLPDLVDRAVAERVAKIFARAEQHALNQTTAAITNGIIREQDGISRISGAFHSVRNAGSECLS